MVADPVRRLALELLLEHDQQAGKLAERLDAEFGVPQPGVWQHLRVLRASGFARDRTDSRRRIHSLNPTPLRDVDDSLLPTGGFGAAGGARWGGCDPRASRNGAHMSATGPLGSITRDGDTIRLVFERP